MRSSVPVILGVAISLVSGLSAEVAQGVVYEDANANGTRDAGERGLEGVAVSNQHEVVLTDAEGHYELPINGDAVIFVSKPSTHALPLNENNLPQFFYTHRPDGSPAHRYAGVSPTGPLPESLDFALLPSEVHPQFRIIAMADPQPDSGRELDFVREDVLSDFAGEDHAFGVVLGDIMFDDLDLLPAYVRALGQTGVPFFHIVGNHDMNYDAPGDDGANETFVSFFGPDCCSWNEGDVHFVALDNIIKEDEGNYREGFTDAEMDWLANDLAVVPSHRLVVLCSHSPIRFAGLRDNGTPRLAENSERLFEVIADRERILALSGHTHHTFQHTFGPEDGWNSPGEFHQINCVTACGSWWGGPTDSRGIPVADQPDGAPNGYTVIAFDGTDYTSTYHAAGMGVEHQMRIYAPGEHASGRSVLVNVFHGAPESVVECSVDGGEFRAMERRPQIDPLAEHYYTGPADTGKSWVDPGVSEHMWQLDLGDGDPSRGAARITVRVQQPDGQGFSQSRIARMR